MALIDKLTDIRDQTSALLTYANGITGASDTRLGDAVRTLGDGYGGGGDDYSNLTAYFSYDSTDWIEVNKVQPNWDNALFNEMHNTLERTLTNYEGNTVQQASARHTFRFKDCIRILSLHALSGAWPTSSVLYLHLGDTLTAGGAVTHSANLAYSIYAEQSIAPVLGQREFTASCTFAFNKSETSALRFDRVGLAIAGLSSSTRCCPLGVFYLTTPIQVVPNEKHTLRLKFTW